MSPGGLHKNSCKFVTRWLAKSSQNPVIVKRRSAQALTQACHCHKVSTRTHTSLQLSHSQHKNSHKPAIVTTSAQELTQDCHHHKVSTRTHTSLSLSQGRHKNSHKPVTVTWSPQELTQDSHDHKVSRRTHTSYLVDGDDPQAAGLWLPAATQQLLHGEDYLLLS